MSIENPMPKLSHSRGVLCVLKPHTVPYGECLKSEKPAKSATIRDSDSPHPILRFIPVFRNTLKRNNVTFFRRKILGIRARLKTEPNKKGYPNQKPKISF